MSTEPDTTAAVEQALHGAEFTARKMGVTLDSFQYARCAIAADRQELERLGYVIVIRGAAPG